MNEKNYLRVTEILKPFTGVEFVPEFILQPAAERGTAVHKMVEGKLKGFEPVDVPENLLGYMQSFDHFFGEWEDKFEDGNLDIEKRLYNDKYEITGMIDCVLKINDRIHIIDWKTSSSVYHHWDVQLSAYSLLYLLELGELNNENIIPLIVKLDKNGKPPKILEVSNIEENIDIFLKCLDLYRYFKMGATR